MSVLRACYSILLYMDDYIICMYIQKLRKSVNPARYVRCGNIMLGIYRKLCARLGCPAYSHNQCREATNQSREFVRAQLPRLHQPPKMPRLHAASFYLSFSLFSRIAIYSIIAIYVWICIHNIRSFYEYIYIQMPLEQPPCFTNLLYALACD